MKVDDKVRVKPDADSNYRGEVGVIINIEPGVPFPIRVRFHAINTSNCYKESELELTK